MPRPFECVGHDLLMLLAGAGALAAEDFGVRRHKAAQKLGILVIQKAYFVLAQIAAFVDLVIHGKWKN